MSVATQRGMIVEGSPLARFKFMFDYGPKIGNPTVTLDENTVMTECIKSLLNSGDELTLEEREFCQKWKDYEIAGFPTMPVDAPADTPTKERPMTDDIEMSAEEQVKARLWAIKYAIDQLELLSDCIDQQGEESPCPDEWASLYNIVLTALAVAGAIRSIEQCANPEPAVEAPAETAPDAAPES
jgi:hypothetical protein